MNQGPAQIQIPPVTKSVKALLIANGATWLIGVVILQKMILGNTLLFDLFALTPATVLTKFWVWQPVTYMFLHSGNVFHILFNMLVLWWFGAELEARWGTKFFLSYYFVCGIGAGLIYLAGTFIHYLITGQVMSMSAPLVGASGATYGLLLAFGLLFGERVMYFMMLFPMKAKFFVLIIGVVELVTLMDSGLGSQTANLAHLGGIAVGFIYLSVAAQWRIRQKAGGGTKARRRLKLVVNNDRNPEPKNNSDEPKYWN